MGAASGATRAALALPTRCPRLITFCAPAAPACPRGSDQRPWNQRQLCLKRTPGNTGGEQRLVGLVSEELCTGISCSTASWRYRQSLCGHCADARQSQRVPILWQSVQRGLSNSCPLSYYGSIVADSFEFVGSFLHAVFSVRNVGYFLFRKKRT